MKIDQKNNDSAFDLVRTPNGIYLRDGRAIPSADYATLGVNNRQSVVAVHARDDLGKGFIGVERGVDVEQGVLELVRSRCARQSE